MRVFQPDHRSTDLLRASPGSFTRRDFLKVAGIGAVALGAARCGSSGASTTQGTRTYLSEPGLHIPEITIDTNLGGLGEGYVLLTSNGPLMVDNAGEPVWYKQVTDKATTDLQVLQYRGAPVLTWWEGELIVPPGFGKGEHVVVDSSYREIARIRAGHGFTADLHELTITPEGTALITVFDTHHADLSAVKGPSKGTLVDCHLQEIDIASGQVLFDWKASEHIDLTESHAPYKPGPYDFFHLNSIGLEPDGNLLISARNTWGLYKIERSTGKVLWRLGGKKSDYTMEPGSVFAWQHHARRHSNGTISVFDDESKPAPLSYSRGLILSVDDATKTVRVAAEYPQPKHLATDSQGSTQILPNGNVFVGWGAEPYYTEFNANAKVVLDAKIGGNGKGSYRAFRMPWSAHPTSVPSLAVHRSGNAANAYVSWNGATEVASWRLRVGSSETSLSQIATAPRTGFETRIPFSGEGSYAVVDALDSSGTRLASSLAVKI